MIKNVPAKGNISDYTFQIDGLQYNTVYEVQVSPYRQIGERREIGNSTSILEVKTACRGKEHNLSSFKVKVLYNCSHP